MGMNLRLMEVGKYFQVPVVLKTLHQSNRSLLYLLAPLYEHLLSLHKQELSFSMHIHILESVEMDSHLHQMENYSYQGALTDLRLRLPKNISGRFLELKQYVLCLMQFV